MFFTILQRRRNFVASSCFLSGKQSSSKTGSTLSGKNLLHGEQRSSFNKLAPLGVIPTETGGKNETSRADDQSKKVSSHPNVYPKTVRRIRSFNNILNP